MRLKSLVAVLALSGVLAGCGAGGTVPTLRAEEQRLARLVRQDHRVAKEFALSASNVAGQHETQATHTLNYGVRMMDGRINRATRKLETLRNRATEAH